MTTGELPPIIDAILAWTVREGVTNVIRHSRAQHCFIRLTREHESVCAEVINDEGQGAHVESTAAKGVGLSGLRERVAALGGRMEAGPLTMDDQGRFRLHVELPIQSDVKGQASWEEQQ
jgi:two-component system sensor histidine kinase DesK